MAEKIVVRELLARLGFEFDDKQIKAFDAGVAKAKANMKDLTQGIAAGVGVAIAAGVALGGVALSAAAAGDEVRKTAQAVSTTTEELQELRHAASIAADATNEELNVALKTQARNAEAASRDTGEAVDAYKALGVQVTDTNGKLKGQVQILEDTAEAFRKGKAEGKETAIAQRLFGESGAKLIPLLKLGKEGLTALRMEAHKYGMVISDDAARQSEEFNDTLTQLKGLILGVKNTIGLALLPTLTELAADFRDWIAANRELLNQRIEVWTERINNGIRTLGETVRRVDKIVVEALGGWEKVILGVAVAVSAVTTALAGWKVIGAVSGLISALNVALGVISTTLGVAMLPLILFLIIALGQLVVALTPPAIAFAGFLLLLEDLWVFLRGGDSLIGRFIEQWRGTEGAIGQTIRAIENAIMFLRELGDIMATIVQIGLELGRVFGTVLFDMIAAWAVPLVELLYEVLNAIGSPLWGAIADTFGGMTTAAQSFDETLESILEKVRQFGEDFDQFRGDNVFQSGVEAIAGQVFAPATALGSGVSNIFNQQSVTQQNSLAISGAGDPAAVGQEVQRALGDALRGARDSVSGGPR